MGTGENENNQWEWGGNKNKMRLNLESGMGTGINQWEREGTRLIKSFSLISRSHSLTCKEHHACLYLISVHQMTPPPIEVANI